MSDEKHLSDCESIESEEEPEVMLPPEAIEEEDAYSKYEKEKQEKIKKWRENMDDSKPS